VGVYWVVSNVFSLFASYYVYGKKVLSWKQLLPIPLEQAPAPAARPKRERVADIEATPAGDVTASEGEPEAPAPREARSEYGKRRGKRKKRR
jgi:hypothetical protein